MTQASRPQADTITNFPSSDAGPYSADQWGGGASIGMFRKLFTGDNRADQGVLVGVSNSFADTITNGPNVVIDTGAGMVNGHFIEMDASVTLTPTPPAANPRIDVVVLVENNTNATKTAGVATANNFFYPTVTTDYDAGPSVPPYSARIVILPGNEAASPVAPTLDVDGANLYMVPLYSYEVTPAGSVSGVTRLWDSVRTPAAGIHLIEEVKLTATATLISFQNIPDYYRHLRMICTFTQTTGISSTVHVNINNDLTSNYYDAYDLTPSLTTAIGLPQIADAGAPAAFPTDVQIDMFNYNGAHAKMIQMSASFYDKFLGALRQREGTGNILFGGVWMGTAPINRIDFDTTAAPTSAFAIGTNCALYGII